MEFDGIRKDEKNLHGKRRVGTCQVAMAGQEAKQRWEAPNVVRGLSISPSGCKGGAGGLKGRVLQCAGANK